ncbi:hypothetical protein JIN86_19590 [Lysinibacillus sp. HST-98]|uniref:hypothetical protein n=1 Tax=Lysinibacillus TaxID=400634 RepID=UPI0001DA5686|nr:MULTISPECIES: hypothetical protein [Lysinibacillus]EFI68757.1 hypothetical protein BFZC1_09325 [Lysinibacillus fusiformis ZC1]EKU42115.1 hypothetical protein C518_3069 [Lysinibacillus fusiformis ZB2]MBL3731778.1 hypothetical protein [Lysinibacillus sp. HST-98]
MKKIFALALLLILTVVIAPSKSFANENNDFISSNPISIENYEGNEEAIQSNIGSTTFAPEQSEQSDEIQTFGLDFARGTISCYVMGSDAFCPWTIQVGGDVITYSNVVVTLKRDEGWLNGGYKDYTTFSFKYPVNIATSTIRNEASFRLPKGHYKAYLGGNFTTAKNGVYSAVVSDPAVFEIK